MPVPVRTTSAYACPVGGPYPSFVNEPARYAPELMVSHVVHEIGVSFVIRIVIVEEVGLLRSALSAVLSSEEDLEVVAELSVLDEAVGAVQTKSADVAVVSVVGPDVHQDVRRLIEAAPGCEILLLSAVRDPRMLQQALRAGARGFVARDLPPAELANLVRLVARGEAVVDPAAAVAALGPSTNPLTERERQVLRIAAEGVSAKEIAHRLFLAHGTVRNHLSSIMRKTGTRNRLQAIRRAQEDGWL